MKRIELRFLEIKDKNEFERALGEMWEDNFDFVHYWESLANKDFEKYVEMALKFAKGELIPKEHVPSTLLFAFNESDEIVGRVSIRHYLTDHLLQVGGHIGYGVCPSFRRKGYATEILKQSLIWVCHNLPKLDKVLLTCDEGNIGSQKTIENNNGVLENIIDTEGSTRKMRYWVSLA